MRLVCRGTQAGKEDLGHIKTMNLTFSVYVRLATSINIYYLIKVPLPGEINLVKHARTNHAQPQQFQHQLTFLNYTSEVVYHLL